MGCCACQDEPSKVEPKSDETEDVPGEEEFFVTDRSCTDFIPLIVVIVLVVGYSFLVHNAVKKGDIYRMINGYDDCANVCGRVTPSETNPIFSCKGADKTKTPYLLVTMGPAGVSSRQCVANCTASPDHVSFLNRCIPKQSTDTTMSVIRKLGLDSFFREASADLNIAWRELVYLLLIALGFSFAILIAFYCVLKWVVYIVLIGVILAGFAGSGYLWFLWYMEKVAVDEQTIFAEDSSMQSYLIYAIILSSVTVVTTLIVLVMRNRIALVMQLFREAGKAVYSMPALLLQPIYTYALLVAAVGAWVYCLLWIESAGDIYKNRKNHFHFKKDTQLVVTRWYNVFLFFFTCEFLLGCQHLVIACAVARWYFTRNKKQVSLPVLKGFSYLTFYHLGTVAFGSLVIGIVRLIRAIVAFVQYRLTKYNNGFVKGIIWCCQGCLWCFEIVLKFLTRNAYIETAIYGCDFCTGGKKAFQALSSNILRVAAINSVGDFVLFLGKVMIVTLTVVSGVYLIQKKEGLQHPWVPITLAGLFAFAVAHCFLSVYEMIIDTIFICFCEDCAKNDGISRPYYMSTGLMEFVENSKVALRNVRRRSRVSS